MTYEESEKNKNGLSSYIKKEGSSDLKVRVRFREPKLLVTHSGHITEQPKYEHLEQYLDSYVSLEDGDHDPKEAKELVFREVQLRHRINEFRKKGYFTAEAPVELKKAPSSNNIPISYRDNLLSHVNGYARSMHNDRKVRASRSRRISGMILAHFKRLSGADEKKAKEEDKRIRLLAKRTAWEIRKKWKVIEREVRRRRAERAAEAQRVAGKEQLANILKHSTDLLEARIERANINISAQTSESAVDWNYLLKTSDDLLSVDELKLKYSNPDLIKNIEREEEAEETSDDEPLSSEDEENEDEDITEESNLRKRKVSDKTRVVNKHPPSLRRSRRFFAKKSYNHVSDLDGEVIVMKKEDITDGVSTKKDLNDGDQNEVPLHDTGSSSSLSLLYNEDVASKKKRRVNDDGLARKKSIAGISEQRKFDEPNGSPVLHANKIQVPFLFRGTLREYQQYGLEWLTALHDSNTNGILADEMGLGKTIQTIALLAHLACEKENWGPHLIIVPTSVMLNWEMEFKKFLPGFKILTYYGNPQERKEKRSGWYKPDTWHVCITSYQLVLQDHQPFRRKKWQYMILDEAHNIKNFRSQRWQSLLNFNAEHRLLLTGTPLQNNLVELWSLLYFLMPAGVTQNNSAFANLKDFQDWFSKPMDRLIEEGQDMNPEAMNTVAKLHRVLRPYLLRRLKTEVEKQMPAKYEHVVYCQLSKRQRFLYDDFINRARTREILASGNFMSIINCLMQLRKVCNHPNLHEERPIVTSFALRRSAIADLEIKDLLVRKRLLHEEPMTKLDLSTLRLIRTDSEAFDTFVSDELNSLCATNAYNRISTFLRMQIDEECKPCQFKKSNFKEHFQNKIYQEQLDKLNFQKYLNESKCSHSPIYGSNLIRLAEKLPKHSTSIDYTLYAKDDPLYLLNTTKALRSCILSTEERASNMKEIIQRFACITPKAVVVDLPELFCKTIPRDLLYEVSRKINPLHQASTRLAIAFPDKRLLQYDCGKLQVLDRLLKDLVSNGHRVLIFTQMTKVLDILEQFLNIHGHRYLRLDGATKIEQRQILTERFNNDDKIPVFILSTRSGGLGINLTGADTVIFYDSDWNPQLDAQAQDRSHRIGQTRDVHIYRLISEYTVESNMLRRANQKRMLDKIVIQGGEFTTEWFRKADVLDLFDLDDESLKKVKADSDSGSTKNEENWEVALAAAEDEEDVQAAQVARKESALEQTEFSETSTPQAMLTKDSTPLSSDSATPGFERDSTEEQSNTNDMDEDRSELEEDLDETVGHIDEYMISFLEQEGTSDEW
ncbi:Helicase swr1 [Schizosaccharomyces pombe]|uniref:Chromatin remodeling protein swr1 n=1 Tax=Schizosaccharomyces pombe (strain 972 / ATCC 24843) TaxID=284812 RepID=SWR1_SCHPO|nr:SNF2 family helicase Swr1 [Schizosaccharomyces pombe]O13682.1 RecName: Full=Helicase swr1 [Schizosaccharomyces pombe 972h-]CAA22447.2 SNF2 family helicase Swr1 [Schizosaccharomyces pombe]|eukprot:NP_001342781.1 SNF2 family helicase Swr1 [Schizosaccharomyces pombe]